MEQYVLLKMVQVGQLGLGPSWAPAEIQVCAPDAKHVETWEMFGSVSIRPGQACTAIAIPKSALGQPVHGGGVGSIPGAERALRDNEPARDFAGSLRRIVGAHLGASHLSIENAAEVGGTSTPTLKRWLAKDGLTYRELVDQVWYKKAERLFFGLEHADERHRP